MNPSMASRLTSLYNKSVLAVKGEGWRNVCRIGHHAFPVMNYGLKFLTSTTRTKPTTRQADVVADVPRVNIGICGEMNSGKSTLMNRITQQQTSIVDNTPGTTADVKITRMEFHGLGPVKLFDTAGLDESGLLGDKKRLKTISAIKESDVALVVIDPVSKMQSIVCGTQKNSEPKSIDVISGSQRFAGALKIEREVLEMMKKKNRKTYVIFNIFGAKQNYFEKCSGIKVQNVENAIMRHLDPSHSIRSLSLDLLSSPESGKKIASYISKTYSPQWSKIPVLPPSVMGRHRSVFMNVPMDAETPKFRLLRPQAMVQEHCLRNFTNVLTYRMDLAAARSGVGRKVGAERRRFLAALKGLQDYSKNLECRCDDCRSGPLLVTDSQAMDIVHPWTLDAKTKTPIIDLTTFSVTLINQMSGGRLDKFVEGIKAFDRLGPNDKVLISEACNHNRITIECDDIGMVQIPNKIQALKGKGVQIDHSCGREFPTGDELRQYSLVVHCGGCMIDYQKIRSRMEDCEDAGVPITNYGLLLSHMKSPMALSRVIAPFLSKPKAPLIEGRNFE